MITPIIVRVVSVKSRELFVLFLVLQLLLLAHCFYHVLRFKVVISF